jgi:hypothetical protein
MDVDDLAVKLFERLLFVVWELGETSVVDKKVSLSQQGTSLTSLSQG